MLVNLPDGAQREFDGHTPYELAQSISRRLGKEAIAAEVDGVVSSLKQELNDGQTVKILTAADEEGLHVVRHTGSHILAQAVKRLFKDKHVHLGIGPAIDTGFYYDIEMDGTLSIDDLAAIEAEMKKIVKESLPIERFTLPREEAIAWAQEHDEPYKVELINDLPEDAVISFYSQGEFTDMCAGPHAPTTNALQNFKLMSLAGAYWRGDEKRPMLQRIYAAAFATKQDLEDYIFRMEEAKKRDHRKLGRDLDLFSIQDEGPGFPFFHPKGMVLRNELINYWRKMHTVAGYEEVSTPLILSSELWKRSGHWDHYRENMYTVSIDDAEYAIKPMNCPGGILMYKRKVVSYRDLPIRMGELGTVHRHELSGALHGLMRVRCFTQDDAHIFMMPEQITDEVVGVLNLMETVYNNFNFKFRVELSTRPENSMGSDEQWEAATDGLRKALERKGWEYKINEGDGAFYGPKIDFHLEDCIGRAWQCGTCQLDFQLPERFELEYDGGDGEKHRPVMVHRTVFGSIERFIGIITEHFAGAFPLWLAPVQARVMTITGRADEAAESLVSKLRAAGIRAELDVRNEKIGFKIRQAQNERIPYMLVIGDREAESGAAAVRKRGQGEIGAMSADEIIALMQQEIAEHTIF